MCLVSGEALHARSQDFCQGGVLGGGGGGGGGGNGHLFSLRRLSMVTYIGCFAVSSK